MVSKVALLQPTQLEQQLHYIIYILEQDGYARQGGSLEGSNVAD